MVECVSLAPNGDGDGGRTPTTVFDYELLRHGFEIFRRAFCGTVGESLMAIVERIALYSFYAPTSTEEHDFVETYRYV